MRKNQSVLYKALPYIKAIMLVATKTAMEVIAITN